MNKILVPTSNAGGLNAIIFPHWEKSPFFAKIVFDEKEIKKIKFHTLKSDQSILNLVKKEDIKEVVALSLGLRAIEILNKYGVQVLTGKIKILQEVIEKYRKKKLYIVKVSKHRQT